jgi:hypothetical protein
LHEQLEIWPLPAGEKELAGHDVQVKGEAAPDAPE